MNKQEAVNQVKLLKARETFMSETIWVKQDDAIDIISQINEPQKPVVQKFVADYIEYCKHEKFYALHGAYANMDDRLKCWRFKGNNSELFAKAWLYGYDIEKEKLYKVIIPHTSNYKNQKQYLVKQGKNWFFCGNDVNRFKYQFTKGQIEAAGFGWVFEQGFAKEV